jgi:hypothetical protein
MANTTSGVALARTFSASLGLATASARSLQAIACARSGSPFSAGLAAPWQNAMRAAKTSTRGSSGR